MRRSAQSCFIILAAVAVLSPICAQAKPKKKVYNNSPEQVFLAAVRTARERHVVTYVDEKMLMFTFETGHSFSSEGFIANASVEPEGASQATLIINVQNKKGMSWGAGDRMADKFYEQVAAPVKTAEKAVVVPDPKAVPATPSITKSADATPASKEEGKIVLTSVPDGVDVYVDDSFVGNAPATLKLPAGKHTVKVSQSGYAAWTKEISVFAGSEVNMKATLEKNQ